MNPLNYASLEVSKKLVDAGIVLETEAYWWKAHQRIDWILQYKNVGIGDMLTQSVNCIPAPSMAEVWRELPEGFQQSRSCPVFWVEAEIHYAAYMQDFRITSPYFNSTNPTDALIDLLIWVKENKDERR